MPLGLAHYDFTETIDDEKDPRFKDEYSEKNKERYFCKHLIRDAQRIMGFDGCFMVICGVLGEYVQSIKNSKLETKNICELEAIVMAAKTSIKEAETKVQMNLSEMFQLLLDMQIDSIKYNRAKTAFIAYSAAKTDIKEDLLNGLFTYLAGILHVERLQESAGTALIALCRCYPGFVANNFDQFLKLTETDVENEDIIIALAIAISNAGGNDF